MIVKKENLNFKEKKISMIIGGVAGIGKTTLALSSPKPILIDLDKGLDRVEAIYRQDSIQVNNYDELLNDLTEDNLKDYETIVIDTGGKLLEFLKPVVIREDNKNGKRNGELSLQGYGAVKRKFKETHKILQKFNKHIVYIFHATEVALANDITGLRIRMEGSAKDEIWDDMDLGGFVEIAGNNRTLGFSNCERYYAKGTHGVCGTFNIPTLKAGVKNDFLTQLFKLYNANLVKECEDAKIYEKALLLKEVIEGSTNKGQINECYKTLKNTQHALTSKEELWFALCEKAKELGLSYDKSRDVFDNSITA